MVMYSFHKIYNAPVYLYSVDNVSPINFIDDVRFSGNIYGDIFTCVNIMSYGAIGNGVSDDTQAFINAFGAVGSGGGVVYLPAGNYLTTGIELNASKVNLVGEGRDVTVLQSHVSVINSVSSSIRSLSIDGNGILCDGVVDFVIDDFIVKNGSGYGLEIKDSTQMKISKGIIRNTGNHAISSSNNNKVIIDTLEIDNWNQSNVAINVRYGASIPNLINSFLINGTQSLCETKTS